MTRDQPKSSTFRDVVQSIAAGLSTSVAGFASSVIVARLLGVTGTASVAIALWIVFVAITIFDFGLSATLARFVPETRSQDDRSTAAAIESLLFRRFLLAILLGVACLAIAYATYWRHQLGNYTDPRIDQPLFYGLILCCFVVHMLFAFSYHRLRAHGRFDRIGALSLTGMAVQIVAVAGLGWQYGPAGALAGYVLGSVPIAVALFRRAPASSVPPPLRKRIARYARTFWIASLLSPLLWSRVDLFLVGQYLDAHAVGLFAAASVVAALLLQICQMICNAILPNLVVATQHRDARRLVAVSRQTIGFLLLVLLPVCFGFAAIAPAVIAVIYGTAFTGAQSAALLLAMATGASAITLVCGNVLNLLERNNDLVGGGAIGAALTIALCVFAIPRYGIVGAAGARVAAQAIVAAITLGQVQRRLPGAICWSTLATKAVGSALTFAAAIYCAGLFSGVFGILLAVIIGAGTFALATTALLLLTGAGRREVNEILQFVGFPGRSSSPV